jgi:hypothetical protein
VSSLSSAKYTFHVRIAGASDKCMYTPTQLTNQVKAEDNQTCMIKVTSCPTNLKIKFLVKSNHQDI